MTATNNSIRTWALSAAVLALTFASPVWADSEAGHVVAIDKESYVLELADEVDVVPGSILQVYENQGSIDVGAHAKNTGQGKSLQTW